MKAFIFCCCFFAAESLHAQELFVYTEPASNMAVKSFAIRINNYLLQNAAGNYSDAVAPEIMVGISKKLMIHAETFFGEAPGAFRFDGGSLYGKYRFFSRDEVHRHFRMAAYSRIAFSNDPVVQPAIELGARNSGAEAGLTATGLMNRIAISAGGSVLQAFHFPAKQNGFTGTANAFNYNLSFGKLLLPKVYKSYKQVNVNIMAELLGQTNAGSGETFIDMAPSVQVILQSRTRLDLGYRFAVVNSLYRMQEKGFLLRFEYNFFNAFK